MNYRDDKGRFLKGRHWRPRKDHWDREWLYQKYVLEFLSTKEIADLTGCTENNIQYWLKKHNIPSRSVSEIRAKKKWGSPGEKNPMWGKRGPEISSWKGGITPERQAFYGSHEWRIAENFVRQRDKGICQDCGTLAKGKRSLHIHHIKSFTEYKELRADPDNLILLCPKCHRARHKEKIKIGI